MRQHRRDSRSQRAARMYALLLRLYPRAYRRAFGDQMLQAFRDHYLASVETHGESEPRFWLLGFLAVPSFLLVSARHSTPRDAQGMPVTAPHG